MDAAKVVSSPERLVAANEDAGTLVAAFGAVAGARVALVDGAQARDKASFMDAVARALAFPDYFGRNWDAFAECLDDLHWHDVPVIVVVDHAAELLAGAPAELDTLLRIVADAFAPDAELPSSTLKLVFADGNKAPAVARAQALGIAVGHA